MDGCEDSGFRWVADRRTNFGQSTIGTETGAKGPELRKQADRTQPACSIFDDLIILGTDRALVFVTIHWHYSRIYYHACKFEIL